MIKFWKSAAKGRSGCPVRPPEPSTSCTSLLGISSMSYTLETILEEGECTLPICGLKKSRLTKNINDILADKNTLGYFVQYMESKSALQLITFWLDVEYFKQTGTEYLHRMSECAHGKLTRTASLDSPKELIISEGINDLSRGKSCQNFNEYTTPNVNKADSPHSLTDSKARDHIRLDHHEIISEKKPIVDDAINLFKKYIALEAPHRLDLSDTVRNTVVQNICNPDGIIDVNCFKLVEDLVFEQLKTYEDGFLQSPLYSKAQIDILTNGSLTLDDILYNEMTLFYFTEYLEQEGCSVLLEFLMVLTNFSDNLVGVYDPDQAQDDAIVLYDKYFSLQATNPIGFPAQVRSLVEQNICREGGPSPDCFHVPFRIVHRTLSRYVKPFLESGLYFKYLTEMINSVDKTWPKKSLSDCSSEFSINTQNTLLAMGDPQFGRKRRNNSVPDMSIDSNNLYDADSLWHRNKQGLSLGRVNSLGRFESKLEPDPDKKRVSVLRRMVHALVPAAAARVDEEMAWQVAHMIVKDVTDLTMSPAHSDK